MPRWVGTAISSSSQACSGLSITHAAWDIDAVHGVHAMYSVSKLGTARSCDVRLSSQPSKRSPVSAAGVRFPSQPSNNRLGGLKAVCLPSLPSRTFGRMPDEAPTARCTVAGTLAMSFTPLNGLTLQWALLMPWESGRKDTTDEKAYRSNFRDPRRCHASAGWTRRGRRRWLHPRRLVGELLGRPDG